MTSYSTNVKVLRVEPQDFGAIATLAPAPGGGIDIDLIDDMTQVHFTEDAAEIVKPGALLTLTLSAP